MIVEQATNELQALVEVVLEAAAQVREELGAEREREAYVAALTRELELREMPLEHAVWVPKRYRALELNFGDIVDVAVDGRVAVVVNPRTGCGEKQEVRLAECLCRMKFAAGLAIDFHAEALEAGCVQVVHPEWLPSEG
jgi:GxxExxY protein